MNKLFVICCLFFAISTTYGQAIKRLPFFGADGGKARINFGAGNRLNENGRTISTMQSDGAVVVLLEVNGISVLARYDANGNQDLTYGTEGFSEIANMFAGRAARQPDGRMVVAGYAADSLPGKYHFAVVRYDTKGSLDQTFNNAYAAHINSGSSDFATCLAIQQDGKIVVAGHSIDSATGNQDIALMRYKSNGTLDPSFSGDGKLTTDILSQHDAITSIALQPDGKILVAGYSENLVTGSADFVLIRYNKNGTLDNSFNGNGISVVDIGGNSKDFANALAIQPDEKIVLAGNTVHAGNGNQDMALVRFNANGILDASFDGDGKLVALTPVVDAANSLTIQPEGKIIVGGTIAHPLPGTQDFALMRYLDNGAADNTFNNGNVLVTNIANGSSDYITQVVLQNDLQIMVIGNSNNPLLNNQDFVLVRYNVDGTVDGSYGESGMRTGFYPFGQHTQMNAVLTQPDTKILMAGYVENLAATVSDFAIARYHADGTPDASFDGDGRLTTDIVAGHDRAYALVLQPDGKFLAAGSAYNALTNSEDMVVVRYQPDGKLDSSFGTNGQVVLDIRPNGGTHALALQSDGKILAAGYFINGTNGILDFALARLLANGAPDLSFDDDGFVTTDFFGANDGATVITIQPDGKIIVAGHAEQTYLGNADIALARYNKNGSLDAGFGSNGKVTKDIYGNVDGAVGVVLQPDGKIVVAGNAYRLNEDNGDIAAARYNADGKPDLSFDDDGVAIVDFMAADMVTDIVLQQNGKLILLGNASAVDAVTQDILLARLGADGEPDASFNGNGSISFDWGGFDAAGAMALSDNKLYVAGHSSNYFFSEGVAAAYQLAENIGVSSFLLVTAAVGTPIQDMKDGDVINMATIKNKSINIRARTGGGIVGSVVMDLSGTQIRRQIENTDPYALFGNDGGTYKIWKPVSGTYTLTATPFSGKNGTGVAGLSHTVSFKIIDSLTLAGFTLVNSRTNTDIAPLLDGAVIDLAVTPYINIRADAGTGIAESVRFGVNSNSNYDTQNSIPFALASDYSGNYLDWQTPLGTYTIQATPYSKNNAAGKPGYPLSITVQIINSAAMHLAGVQSNRVVEHLTTKGLLLKSYPNPVSGTAFIEFSLPQQDYVSIIITDASGNIIQRLFSGKAVKGTNYRRTVNTTVLPAGIYFCRLQTGQGQRAVISIIKQ